jgi:hypothetical protein
MRTGRRHVLLFSANLLLLLTTPTSPAPLSVTLMLLVFDFPRESKK